MSYTEQFMEYDPFVSATEPSNPWISDDTTFWDLEARWGRRRCVSSRGLNRRWGQVARGGLGSNDLLLLGGMCLFASRLTWEPALPSPKVCCAPTSRPLLPADRAGKWLANNTLFFFYSVPFYRILFGFILSSRDPSQQRVKKWGFSLEEALKDPAGRDQFLKFLESEFSSENLRWASLSKLPDLSQSIFLYFKWAALIHQDHC